MNIQAFFFCFYVHYANSNIWLQLINVISLQMLTNYDYDK